MVEKGQAQRPLFNVAPCVHATLESGHMQVLILEGVPETPSTDESQCFGPSNGHSVVPEGR